MRLHQTIGLSAIIAVLAAAPSVAQTGMKNGSADASTTKARCSPGDPNVMLNTKTKTYTLDTSSPAPTHSGAPMSPAPMASAGMSSSGESTMKSVCKSEAISMGAKMAPMSSSSAMPNPKST